MALLLAVARKTVLIDQHCRQGDWKKITTRDVTGGTIGILGLGAIGRNVAQRAQGFGMKVLAHDPSGTRRTPRPTASPAPPPTRFSPSATSSPSTCP